MVTDSVLVKICEECHISPPSRAEQDIAEWNLLLASGLPGSEDLNIDDVLAKIDEWTDKVRHATSRNYDLFLRNPAQFDNSLGKFYMAVLSSTLQGECGVAYNPERKLNPGDARDSRDRFIHGITHGNGGTCASLPVLYAAIGRRLGYPLKLVFGARHLFLRWDESDSTSPLVRDRFNIEATSPQRFISPPDDYYLNHPFPHPDPDVNPKEYLRSLTPAEELAVFLGVRSIVLMDNGKFLEAIQPAAWARQLAPHDDSIKVHLELTMLFALKLVDEKPKWMDDQPMILSNGVAVSRYWWPRPVEKRNWLPAAALPRNILARILPPDGPDKKPGDLADALYERVHHYADIECCKRAIQAAQKQLSQAANDRYDAIRRIQLSEKWEQNRTPNPQPPMPGVFPYQPPGFPSMPGVPARPGPMTHGVSGHQPGQNGFPHQPNGMHFPQQPLPPAFGPKMSNVEEFHRIAQTHHVHTYVDNGPLFQDMGQPSKLLHQRLLAFPPTLKETHHVL